MGDHPLDLDALQKLYDIAAQGDDDVRDKVYACVPLLIAELFEARRKIARLEGDHPNIDIPERAEP